MSKSIDQKVVEMRFDNANFEKNARTSMSTLDKLKQSLKFEDSAKGFENLSRAAGKVDMGGLSSGVDAVKMRFSALEVMAVTALSNITNKAVDTGLQLVKSLSVDQISEGWSKFTSKTSSVATLVAQGYELETVNEQLDRLNWYTDETSYNFTDMVSNIAKFTATGKGLEESVTAMEGIANWAALSGQNAATASHAMYQLSQAMGAGYMRLEDYKSIQNASMDTEEFRQKCIDAGVALGTLKDNGDGTYKSLVEDIKDGDFTISQFAQHLTQDAWLTSDVMMEVFQNYSNAVDQIYEYADEKGITASQAIEELGDSVDAFGLKAFKAAQEARSWADVVDSVKDAVSTGWMSTFELIFGNQEEATRLWTDLANAMYDVFASGSETRNELLAEWKELGGRDMLLESFWNSWNAFFGDGEEIVGVIGTIKEAFSDIFPPMTAERLVQITEKVRDLTEKFKMSEETSNNLKSTFKGLFAILDIGKQGFEAIAEIAGHLLKKLLPVGEGVLGITGDLGEMLVKLDEAIKQGDGLTGFVEFSKTLIDKLSDGISVATDYLVDFISSLLGIDFTKFESFGEVISAVLEKLKDFNQKIQETFPWIADFQEKVVEAFQAIRISSDSDLGNVETVLEKIRTVMSSVKELFSKFAQKIGTFLSPVVEKLKDIFSDVTITDLIGTGFLAGIFKAIKKIANALSGFGEIGESVTNLLDTARNAISLWQKDIKSDIILKIAAAVGILAAALFVISKVDADRVLSSLGAISALLGEVTIVITSIMAWNKQANMVQGLAESLQFSKLASGMLVIAGAVLILAAALKKCEGLDWDNTLPAMTALLALLAEMCVVTRILEKTKGVSDAKTIKSVAVDMIVIATAVKILASAISKLGELDFDQVAIGMSALLVTMDVITKKMASLKSVGGNLDGVAGSMIGMAAAITMLYVPISLFAKMDIDALIQGGIAVGVGLFAIVAAVSKVKGVEGNLTSVASTFLGIAAALTLLVIPIKVMGAMNWDELCTGLTGVMVSLLAVGSALHFLSETNTTGIGVSMLAFSAALTLLVIPIKTLGSMSLTSLAKGIVAFAIAVGVLVGAAYLLTPLTGSLTQLGKALLGFGAACLGIGVLIGAITFAFVSLATVGAAGVAAILAAVSGLISGFRLMLPIIGEALKDLILTYCDVIKDTAPSLVETALYVIDELLAQIENYVPSIVEHLAQIIKKIGTAITETFGEITLEDWGGAALFTGLVAATSLIVKAFSSVAKDVPKALIGVAGVLAILVVVGGVITAMTLLDTESVLTVAASLSAVLLSLSATITLLGFMPLTAGLSAGLALAEFVGVMAAVMAVLGGLNQIPGFNWLMEGGIQVLGQIGEALGAFIGGIIGSAIEKVTEGIAESGTNLSNFMTNIQPFLEGASKIDSSVLSGVDALVDTIISLTKAELLSSLTSWLTGGTVLSDFGEELAEFGPLFADFSSSVSGVDVNAVDAAGRALKSIAEAASSIPNEGGLISKIVGDNTLAQFAEGLKPFGEALMDYGKSVAGIESYADDIEHSKTAAEALIALADIIPNSGGLLGLIVGNNDLADFAKGLKPFGEALMDYGKAVVGMSTYTDEIKGSVDAAEELIKIADIIPNSGGWLGKIVGNNDLADFAEGLKPFGEALMDYGNAVNGISGLKKEIKSSVDAAESVIDLANSIQNASSGKDLSTFGSYLTTFAQHIKEFVNECATLNSGQLDSLKEALQSITDIARDFAQIDTTAIDSFVDSMKTIGETSVADFLSSFTDSNTEASSAVATLMQHLTDAIKSKHSDLKRAFTSAAEAGLKGITSKKSSFQSAGGDLMKAVTNGASGQTSALQTKFTSMLTSCVTAVRNFYSQFQSAGSYLVSGLANGITANTSTATAAASKVASKAAASLNQTLKIKSPSRLTFKSGNYFGVGFVNGILNNVKRAKTSGAELGDSAESSLSNAVRKIKELIDSDIDTAPTIRPVIDLTEIQNGVAALNDLMNSLSGGSVNSTVSIAGKTANAMDRSTSEAHASATKATETPSNETVTNTFYITGSDPKAIADEVDRKLQRRIERRNAAWA